MKTHMQVVTLALCAAWAVAEESRPVAEPQDWLPAAPNPADLAGREDITAARSAIKKVIFLQTARLKHERHRLTAENAKESAKLSAESEAPAEFTRMMQLQTERPLNSRDGYEHARRLEQILQAYGVDALQIRLFIEGNRCTLAELRALAEWLPYADVFDLVQDATLPDDAELYAQMDTLQAIYRSMEEIYRSVETKEQADAAADALLPQLAEYKKTLPLRLLLQRLDVDRFLPYQQRVGKIAKLLITQKKRLNEVAFYGSRKLEVLDALLSA